MKILFFIHGISGGGGERVLSILANEFVARGESVSIATRVIKPFAYQIDERIALCDLYAGTRCGVGSRLLNLIIMRRNIRRIVKNEKPDLVVAFMSALGCSVVVATLGLGVPVVISEHTNVSRNLGRALSLKRALCYPLADAITILTRYDRRLWQNKYKNVVYMPNPISLRNVGKMTVREKTVLAVGRVKQWNIKGFDNLLKCWANICHLYPDWTLKIAGAIDDKSEAYLTALADEWHCRNYEFLGFRNDVYELMQQSAVFCLSSRTEGLPMALLEAMNAGCCCVSFDVVTGPREIIQNGKSGLIATNQDNEDLTRCLKQVIEDDLLRKRLAENAQDGIRKYSLERVVGRWYVLFDKIIKKKPKPKHNVESI